MLDELDDCKRQRAFELMLDRIACNGRKLQAHLLQTQGVLPCEDLAAGTLKRDAACFHHDDAICCKRLLHVMRDEHDGCARIVNLLQ